MKLPAMIQLLKIIRKIISGYCVYVGVRMVTRLEQKMGSEVMVLCPAEERLLGGGPAMKKSFLYFSLIKCHFCTAI